MLFFVFAAFAGARGNVEEEKDSLGLTGLIDVKACEGVEITQCELAKNLINTLKMGEDLTCESCFIHLQALGISPGEDWGYEDPHKVVTVEEIKEVALEIHGAYNSGSVRLDGFEAAAAVNRFCRDMKGPATLVPMEKEEKKAETEAETETKAEAAVEIEAVTETEIEAETETPATPPSQKSQDKGPASSEEAEQEEPPPPAGTEESATHTEENK